jgi:hypothetical protein
MKTQLLRMLIPALLFLLSGCQALSSTQDVPFNELVSDPDEYSGKQICTEGILVGGFEVSALGADIYKRDGYVYLVEPAIWIERAEITQQGMCTDTEGYSFCPVRVCGEFEFGGSYGHVGAYLYQISTP